MQPPGLVSATTINGIRNFSSQGLRRSLDIPAPLPMSVETSFDIASITKILFTTNLFMYLVDRSEIQISDPVCRYLPQWNTSEKSQITVEHLLNHRSGLEPWRPLYINCDSPLDAHHWIASHPLTREVNATRIYSDLGFITLGAVLEEIFQKDLVSLLNEVLKPIFPFAHSQFAKPIDLANVAATSRGDIVEYTMVKTGDPYSIPERVDGFRNWRKNVLVGEVNDGNSFHLFSGASSHAGIFSTAEDLIQMCEIYLNSFSDNGLFKSSTIKQFCSPSIDPIQNLGFRNWYVQTAKGVEHVIGHTGFTGAAIGFVPDLNFGAVLLSNRLHTDEIPVKTEDVWLPFLENSLRDR